MDCPRPNQLFPPVAKNPPLAQILKLKAAATRAKARWHHSKGVLGAICLALTLPTAVKLWAATTLEPIGESPLPACSVIDPALHPVEALPEVPILPLPPIFTLPAPTNFPPVGYLPSTRQKQKPAQAGATGTDWGAALHQSGRFLFIQHAVRIGTQRKTRRELRGPFFRDYINSVRGFSGWDDGDSWLTNYVGHPMQGSISGYFQVHSHPRERLLEFSSNSAYWKSRLKAMAFNAAYSTHYELGPLGEAAIGNVGLRPGTKGAVDLVITPTLGFAWMVGEDAIDAKIIAPLERRLRNPGSRRLLRTALNPTRTFANVLRGAAPWRRDTRGDVK